jgi:uncharacterized protein YcbX
MTASIADFDLACAAAALFVYPVKACAGMAVDELVLDERGGAVGDRGWAVVDAEHAVTWQGAHPRLALVRPRARDAALLLEADGVEPIAAPDAAALVPCQVRIWNDAMARHDIFEAADAGDAVAAWLAQVCGAPLRLVKLGAAARARDGVNALHLVFSASAAAVDAALASAGLPAADLRRYRPNIVLAMPAGTAGIEFIEESLEALEWQRGATATRLQVTAPCVRCVVPNVDPASGRVDDAVLDTLARLSQQRRPGGATVFGVYARGPAGARLRPGDGARMELAF